MLQAGMVTALGVLAGQASGRVRAALIRTDGAIIACFGESCLRAPHVEDGAPRQADPGQASEVTREIARLVDDLAARGVAAEIAGLDCRIRAQDAECAAALAGALGLPVVRDFRSSDLQLGGLGEPLAAFFHFACARWIGATAPLAFLDLGATGRLTWVDPTQPGPEVPGALLAFETGPANAPLDALLHERRGMAFDRDGALAQQGEVAEGALEMFLDEPYFLKMPPKVLDRNDFSLMLDLVRELGDADAAATMCAMAASAVMRGMEHCPTPPRTVFVTGGGRNNPVTMQMLRAALDCPVLPVEDAGLDGDMMDAQAIAFLAVRVARGLPTTAPSTTGVPALVGGGEITYPGARPSSVL